MKDGMLILYRQFVKAEGSVHVPSRGSSMYPAIREGDLCQFVDIDLTRYRPSDILLYLDADGNLIGHRLIRTVPGRQSRMMQFRLKGDANMLEDRMIEGERILGKLVRIQRGQRVIEADSAGMRIWGAMIVRLPMLSAVIRRLAQWS